ncbi:hypothetical protein OAA09_01610 [bacterium]|nr:hypothetical protein [bacterium]
MKESTLVKMQRDIRNLTITLSIVIERLKKLEEQDESKQGS